MMKDMLSSGPVEQQIEPVETKLDELGAADGLSDCTLGPEWEREGSETD